MTDKLSPRISWWNELNTKRISTNETLFGEIKQGQSSDIVKILMWNNRGGTEECDNTSWDNVTEDRTDLGIAGAFYFKNLSPLDDFLLQGWLRVAFVDLTVSELQIEERLNDEASKIIGATTQVLSFSSAGGRKHYLSGATNTGALGDLDNYTIMVMRIDVPKNAPEGDRRFSFYWQII